MIYVTCGHEKGIGLEAFIKSFLMLNPKKREKFKLICPADLLIQNLANLKLTSYFNYFNKSLINISSKVNPTIDSLLHAIEVINPKDILLTLPSSKNQFKYESKSFSGHTEFFRSFYEDQNILMIFEYNKRISILLTDHIPLRDVTNTISRDLIINKITLFINNHFETLSNNTTFYFSGINPHAGENGTLGSEDSIITDSIKTLAKNFLNFNFKGPLSGDTLHLNDGIHVYMYHDQGLSSFKSINGLCGLNITLGLPYLRMSVDHGTAFDLYGKNLVDHMGTYYMLNKAIKLESNE